MTKDITQISDEMLRELWLSEQLPASVYANELIRRVEDNEPQSIGALVNCVVIDLQARRAERDAR